MGKDIEDASFCGPGWCSCVDGGLCAHARSCATPPYRAARQRPDGDAARGKGVAGGLPGWPCHSCCPGGWGTCRGCFDQFPDGNEFGLFLSPHRQPEGLQVTGTTENPYMSQQEKMDNLERQARIEDCERIKNRATCIDEEDYRERAKSGIKKRGNPAVTVGLPVVVTSGFSFVLLKFLNK